MSSAALHAAGRDRPLAYTLLRENENQVLNITVDRIPSGSRSLYLRRSRRSASSRCSSARASGCGVRTTRPRCTSSGCAWRSSACWRSRSAAGSTRSTGSSTGATSSPALLLPPLFVHFALVFPERPDSWARSDTGRRCCRCCTCRRCSSAGARRDRCCAAAAERTGALDASSRCVERGELLYLAALPRSPVSAIMTRALGRVRSVTARRQLRWIVWGTALGAVPFVVRLRASVRARVHAAPRVRADRRSCSASCRWRLPRRSSATA